MKYGICLDSSIAIRKNPSHQSELISQLLFGETYLVLQTLPYWLQIKCSYDEYTGWIDRLNAQALTEQSFKMLLQSSHKVILAEKLRLVTEKGTNLLAVPGSELPFYSFDNKGFKVDNIFFKIVEKPEIIDADYTSETIIKIAEKFLNTPYLWGGRSISGIDCSGFTQVVFKINHINLPRDTWQQATAGSPIDDFKEAGRGDLAFFKNEKNKICHTGILMDKNVIVHASGRVRIDKLDAEGIFNTEKQAYTHKLDCIRRVL